MKKNEQKNNEELKKAEPNELESLKLKSQELQKQLDAEIKLNNDLKIQLNEKSKHLDEKSNGSSKTTRFWDQKDAR